MRRTFLLALACLCPAVSLRADTVTGTVVSPDSDTLSAATASDAATGDDSICTQKAADIAHFWQRDPRAGFENEGRDYCSPVAVSNSFYYLARHGFPALFPEGDPVQSQIDVIKVLASSDYFATDPTTGTPPGGVLAGVRKYVEEKGYQCERLEYEGWRPVGRSQKDAIMAARPSLHWLKQGVLDPHGAVWLNVGWYTKVGDGEWKRTGGHWVTLVGYGGTSPDDTADPHLLLIHNPLKRGSDGTPDDPAQDVIHLTKIDEGTLDTGKDSTEDAAGMYEISGPGLPMGHGVESFLDAAIVLVVGS